MLVGVLDTGIDGTHPDLIDSLYTPINPNDNLHMTFSTLTGEGVSAATPTDPYGHGTHVAGKIHTDFERGFIRAEVVNYQTLLECGSLAAAKEKGKVRSEGKDYVMQDGDVVLFRFNV